ncbi:MAG: CBS domain-containing protein [Cytophagaceae bacterium]
MLAEELINQMIPPLKLTDTAQVALNWMEVFRLSQLPVIDKNQYIGLLSEETILDKNDSSLAIGEFPLDFKDLKAAPSAHYYELIQMANKHKVELLPVVDEDNQYIGVVSVNETSAAIAQMFASQGPGGIIVLHMKDNDYTLTQIARLIESNDTKIISLFVANDEKNPGFVKVTIKLNRVDLTRVIATLERYDYRIIAHFQETDTENQDKDRLDLLFKYLNI